MLTTGLYIHIPFCRSKCPYCDFYSVAYNKALADDYISILTKEIKKINTPISTVYFGGGTPTVLTPGQWQRLLLPLGGILARSRENTIEANPESVAADLLTLLYRKGINRISLGMQSFRDQKLKVLGRIHTVNDNFRALKQAKVSGFKNISIDLIYGLPYEGLSPWKEELKEAAGLPITHLSCYVLTFERGRPIYSQRKLVDDETIAEMLRFTNSFLPKRGFCHYEVSNFAQPRFFCRHNMHYWQNYQYIGLGPSAVSLIDNRRSKNVSSVSDYISKLKKGQSGRQSVEQLSPLKRARELLALGIRTAAGIDFKHFKTSTGIDFFSLIDTGGIKRLKAQGLLKVKKDKGAIVAISLTQKGFLFCDEVSAAFL